MITLHKSFGKLTPHRVEVTVNETEYKYLAFKNADGIEWHDLVSEFGPYDFYIAVDELQRIVSMESDADHMQIGGLEIIGLKVNGDFQFTRGPGGNVYGKVWDGAKIVDPAPETSLPSLSARQLRLGLVSNGISLSQVEATIDAIENQQDRDVARIEWEYASTFDRHHPLIEQVGAALGLTTEQIDTMWAAALSL